ncbi:MAG: fatty acid oxidation complex subunit alpha FadB [Cellvibrionales bacterium]|nr:fatty acid oxidation complex subunit alpha FadB [Porticoccaceae bacterium]|tara:strand:- start:1731 stop:3890 length:2160 start_codon:yes stop_codon:yes gene_type:complete
MYKGNTLTLVSLDNGLVELCFNNHSESVNKLDLATTKEFAEAIETLSKQTGIRGLLVSSAKSVFIVGADIGEFSEMFKLSEETFVHRVGKVTDPLNQLEELPFPTLVAINGYALGGGLEVCLACDYRIIAASAAIGLPETTLGIIPGWGGTVRLPRLCGVSIALQWTTSGAPQSADKAVAAGAVHEVVEADELREVALHRLAELANGDREYRSQRLLKMVGVSETEADIADLAQQYRTKLEGGKGQHYPAPLLLVDLLERAARLDRDAAQVLETDSFYHISRTPQARALVGVFLNDQYLTKVAKTRVKVFRDDATVIERNGVIGAGIMGGGIAYQNAIRGYSVLMKDINQEALDLGMSEACKLLAKGVDRGKLTPINSLNTLAKITPTLTYSGLETCQVIVEAVVENPAVKKAVLADIESAADEGAILTSNTSTISIDLLAEGLQRPENFCGMHFFNPVNAMPLVEIIRSESSSEKAVATLCNYALGLGKKPVVVNDCPGFLVNRTLFAMLFGFEILLREGADYQQIDAVMESWGWPMGPAYLIDVIGIDTLNHCYSSMVAGLPERFSQGGKTLASEAIYAAGRLGQKNALGYYKYALNQRGKPEKHADEEATAIVASVAAPRKVFSESEIIERIMLPMAMEMSRCLDEGVVASPAEADMALIYGVGFPRFRGGICRWMDELGLADICALGDRYASISTLYQPTDELRARAAKAECWYS